MRLLDTVLLSALQGLTEVLPVSRSGHGAVARLWLTSDEGALTLEGVLQLSTAAAAAMIARRRLAAALSQGVRAIARPTLFRTAPGAQDAVALVLAMAVSLVVGAAARPYGEVFRGAPIAVGLGLLTTGLALASVVFAPKPRAEALSMPAAVFLGAVHGLSVFPGASGVAAALTLLLWLGIKPARAIDFALLISIPSLVVAFAKSLAGVAAHSNGGGLDLGTVAMGCVVAFLCATLAGSALRALLARRKLAALSLWLIPLGLAMCAYARALDGSGT
ncbi:MAG: UDP kinase [Polyangiaceae bacterium]|nr:UDP kinase [Polyangiaceae bacterium]